jgi:Zn-finger nucleic acid-binding protein
VEFQECRRDGFWLDAGNLEKLLGRTPFDPTAVIQSTPSRRCTRCGHLHDHPAPSCDLCGALLGLTCVACQARLSRLDAQGADLEVCPSCQGTWVGRHAVALLGWSSAAAGPGATCARCSTALPATTAYYGDVGAICDNCRNLPDYHAWQLQRRAQHQQRLEQPQGKSPVYDSLMTRTRG